MNIPQALLQMYKDEFLHTSITIEELCNKYSVTTKQLKGYTKWVKDIPAEPDNTKEVVELIDTPREIESTNSLPVEVIANEPDKTPDTIKTNIAEFKALAIDHAIKFMEKDVKYAEVKEFKDIVAIVDTIEKSYKSTQDTSQPVNVLIQNIINKFEDDV